MKRFLAAILLVLMLLGTTSCATKANVPDDYMSVSHADEIFNLYVPKSWQSNTDSGVSGGYSSLTSGVMVSATTLDGYSDELLACAEAVVQDFSETLPEFEQLTELKKTTLGSYAAMSFEYKAVSAERTLKFRCILVKKDDTLTVLSCCAPVDTFENYTETFDDIASYFSFRSSGEVETEEPFVLLDDNTPSGYQLAARSKYEFRFYVPQSWNVDTTGNIPAATFSDTDRSNVTLNSFTVKADVTNGKEYWEAFKQDYRYHLEEISLNENAEMGKYPAYAVEYKTELGGERYFVKQVFLTTPSIIYIFTYTSDEANYYLHLEEVDAMLSLFEFKK